MVLWVGQQLVTNGRPSHLGGKVATSLPGMTSPGLQPFHGSLHQIIPLQDSPAHWVAGRQLHDLRLPYAP